MFYWSKIAKQTYNLETMTVKVVMCNIYIENIYKQQKRLKLTYI